MPDRGVAAVEDGHERAAVGEGGAEVAHPITGVLLYPVQQLRLDVGHVVRALDVLGVGDGGCGVNDV